MPLSYLLVRTGQGGLSAWWDTVATERVARLATTSLLLALVVTVACLVIGVAGAWLVTRSNTPGRRVFAVLLALPLAVPSYVAAFTWVSVADLWTTSPGARFEGFLASVVGGPLVLYDAQLGVHLFDSTGAFARRLKPGRGIPQPLREPAILGGEVLAVASYTRSTRAPDRPVELFGLEDGEFIGALGPPSALDPETGILDVPHLAAGCAGELWLHGAEPTFTRWNVRGEQTAAFQLDSAAVAAAASAVGIPPGLIATLRLHEDCDAGVRWLAIVLRDRAALTQADVAPGDPLPPALLSPSHIHRTHDTLILAVDASSDALLAGAALPRAINHFLADGRIAVDIEEASGHQYVQLYRLTLQR